MSYNSEDYFLSNDFHSLLKRFEENENNGGYVLLNSDELIDIAEYYHNSGNRGRASEITEKTLALYPGSAAPLLFKARIALIEENDIAKAERYTEMIEDKSDLEYFYMKAEIMLAQGKPDNANQYLEDMFSTVSDEDKDYFTIDSAALFIDYEYTDFAEQWLERTEDKELIEYKEQSARILMEKGEYEESKKLFNELIDLDPYSTQYWNALASSQFFNNNIEDSIQSSEYSIAINPQNTVALLNKANGLYNLGNFKEALKYYQRYNEQCPDDETGEMLMGFCHLLLDEFEEAVIHLTKAEKLAKPQSPNLIDIYKDLSFALCRTNRVDEAMTVMDKTLKLDCDHNEMLVYRGNMLMGCGRLAESKKCFIKALKDSKFSPNIFMLISISVFEAGDIKLAYKMFHLLFSNYKEWKDGYAYLATCCYELGKTDEFLECLKKAAINTPSDLKMLLGRLFPEGMKPEDYYQYLINNNKNKQ